MQSGRWQGVRREWRTCRTIILCCVIIVSMIASSAVSAGTETPSRATPELAGDSVSTGSYYIYTADRSTIGSRTSAGIGFTDLFNYQSMPPAREVQSAGVVARSSGSRLQATSYRSPVSQTSDPLIVDDDGTAQYDSIRAAIDNATSGDVVEVRPGEYTGTVVVDKNITVRAPQGATISNADEGFFIGSPFERAKSVSPTISGFTITNSDFGVRVESNGNWALSNLNIRNVTFGINGEDVGDGWVIRESTIVETENEGIEFDGGFEDANDWTIKDTHIRSTGGEGIEIDNSGSDWTVRNVTVQQANGGGVRFDGAQNATVSDLTVSSSPNRAGVRIEGDKFVMTGVRTTRVGVIIDSGSGDWEIRNAVINATNRTALKINDNSGDWRIQNVSISTNREGIDISEDNVISSDWEISQATIQAGDDGVRAVGTSGNWTIQQSIIRMNDRGRAVTAFSTAGSWDIEQSVLSAPDSAVALVFAGDGGPTDDATQNYWGQPSGAEPTDCDGNVDCSDGLSEQPSNAGFRMDGGSAEPAPSPTLSVTAQQSGTSEETVQIEYAISNVSEESSVALEFSNLPSKLSINTSASETRGTFEPGNQRIRFTNPTSEVTATIVFDVESTADAGETFIIEADALNEDDTITDSTSTTVSGVKIETVERFDANENGEADLPEVRTAINAFANGELNIQGVRTMINTWAS